MESDEDYDEYWMFSTDDEGEGGTVMPVEGTSHNDDDRIITGMPSLKRGRKSIVERHPEIISVVDTYIKENSAEAHNRRHDATAYTNGVTLNDIKQHVEKTIPGIGSVSRVTVHRMMKPARKKTHNAKRHKGLVDARVPAKQNSSAKDHPDFHYSCASINYMNELVFLCDDETLALSCDDKNKVNVGTLAVSRHFQIRRFFSVTDTPNYPDHDFPYRNSKLTPSGYMCLERKRRSRSVSPKRPPTVELLKRRARSTSPQGKSGTPFIRKDKTGRTHVSWPRSGPLTVYLQAGKFKDSTSQSHACHLSEVLNPLINDLINPKTVVSVIADGGPDWSTKSLVNLINYGRLWRDMNMDALIMSAYAPGYSRFNPVERSWGPLSKWLTGVTLPIILDGEERAPCEQTGLSDDERTAKEVRVFDNALEMCSKYWHGKQYDSFPVSVHCVPCDANVRTDKYTDHAVIKQFVDSSARAIKNSPVLGDVQHELSFLISHCVRRTYQLEFYKCLSAECNHCKHRPIRAKKFFKMLNRLGGKIPSPVTDPARCKGEFLTLKRLLEVPGYIQTELDKELPSREVHVCEKGCQYAFRSKRDETRHRTLCHPRN